MSAKLTCIFYSPSKRLFPFSLQNQSQHHLHHRLQFLHLPPPPPEIFTSLLTSWPMKTHLKWSAALTKTPWTLVIKTTTFTAKDEFGSVPTSELGVPVYIFLYIYIYIYKLFDWLVVTRILDGIWRGNHKRWKSWKTFERFWWKLGNICYDFRLSHVSPELEVHLGSAIILCKIVVFNLGYRILKFGLFEIFKLSKFYYTFELAWQIWLFETFRGVWTLKVKPMALIIPTVYLHRQDLNLSSISSPASTSPRSNMSLLLPTQSLLSQLLIHLHYFHF